MAERTYQGAHIGIERMNRILDLLLFKSMTITDVSLSLCICDRAAKKYLAKLLQLEKITVRRGEPDARIKFYSLVPGAMPLPVPQLLKPRRRPLVVEKQKTGPKPKRLDKKAWNSGLRTVKTVPAQQVGMARDPLIEMFFGKAA
jgi:hypothetical protein